MNATEHEKVSKARADLDAAEDYINSLDLAPNLVHRLRSGIAALDELLAQPVEPTNERMEHALHSIKSWSEAYPLAVFPEPDFKRAHEVLTANGMTLDAISASNMRHVIKTVQSIAEAALAAAPQPKAEANA